MRGEHTAVASVFPAAPSRFLLSTTHDPLTGGGGAGAWEEEPCLFP